VAKSTAGLPQMTANNTRTVEQKKAMFRRIAELLGEGQ
jgi:hypothetical protein